ncbi:protein mitoshell [Calliphora vicina]|uniref:protein mitoshell n=1 Tax=Calliphora vicina TaxID=7373 RepID=UPI00325BAE94
MNDHQMRHKKPRKILGNGPSTEYSNSVNNLSGHIWNQTAQQNSQLNNTNYQSINSLTLTDPINSITSLHLQQQQQMERLRLANIMNQEMHALWPYGTATFLSPMLPAHNMHLPYALAGTLPYAAVPIYQSLPNAQPCTVSPVSSSSSGSSSVVTSTTNQQQQQQSQILQQHLLRSNSISSNNSSALGNGSVVSTTNQNSVNDPNKINIQIGLQCVSQNAPLNINSMNDTFAKVNLLNFCNPSGQMVEKDCKESNSSLRNSPVLLSSDDSSGVIINGAGGDATNSLSPGSSNGTVTLSQAKFNELTRLALRGSEIAEKLAYTHRNRPCFKKIDSLCARMKQDLIRPDGVLPNINSQGIAWAVKDFIFVFTRVINAWIIIKGYVYNTPEGLNKVKSALSPDFAESFAAWQDTTMDFIENLIKSFVNLDNLVQSQKNVYQKSDNTPATAAGNRNNNISSNTSTTPIKILQPGYPLMEESFDFLNSSAEKCTQNSLNKNYIYTMVEDSEGSQRQATENGTYFKTGTYNPIKKDPLLPGETCSDSSGHLFATTTNTALEQYIDEHINEFWSPAVDMDLSTTSNDNAVASTTSDFIKLKENIAANWLNYDLRVLQHHLSEFSTDYDPNGPPRPLGKDLIEKLNIMIERLNAMKSADFFFKIQFTENYFPEFVAKHKTDFMDIRSIIFKCQIGGYQHIYEVVHDVRKIIYVGKEFLKINNDTNLQKSIMAFEVEFNKLLSEAPFENLQFDHIKGDPKETIYTSTNINN